MKPIIATVTTAAALAIAGAAFAQDLPRWNLGQACAAEANGSAYCVAFESRAFGYLSGIWSTLKPEIRAACLGQVESFGQQSYRLLGDCIEDRLTALRVEHVRGALRADVADPPGAPPPRTEQRVTPAEAEAPPR